MYYLRVYVYSTLVNRLVNCLLLFVIFALTCAHLCVCGLLLSFRVVEYGHINKMMSTNVSIVFGPTLMRAEVDSIEMATLMPVQNNIVETFLTETEKVFSK